MANIESTINLNVNVEGTDNLKNLKTQIREAKQEVEKFEEGSQAFIRASQNVAKLSDKLDDVNDQVKLLKGDALERVASGFKGVGSAILDLDVGRLTAANNSLKGIDFKSLKDNVKDFGSALLGVATNPFFLIPAAIGLIIQNFDDLKKMFPAIQGVVDSLTEAMNYLLGKTGEVYEEQKKFAEQQKLSAEYAQEQATAVSKESTEFVGLIYQLKATNETSKERATLIDDINKKYGTTLKNLKDEKEFQTQLNGEVAKYLEIQKAKFTLQKNQEAITVQMEKLFKAEQERARIENIFTKEGAAGETLGDFTRRRNEYGVTLAKASIQIGEANAALEKLGAKALEVGAVIPKAVDEVKTKETKSPEVKKKQTTLDELAEMAAKELVDAEKNAETLSNIRIKYADKSVETELNRLEKLDIEKATLLGESEENLQKIRDFYSDKRKAIAEEKLKTFLESVKQIEITGEDEKQRALDVVENKRLEDKKKLQDEYNLLSDEEKINQKQRLADAFVAIDQDAADKVDKINEDAADKEKNRKKRMFDEIVKFALDMTAGLSSLNDLVTTQRTKGLIKGSKEEQKYAKEGFERGKKIAIANAVIQGIAGIVNVMTAKSVFPEPFGMIAKVAQSVALGISTAANVAKIKATQFNATSPPSTDTPAPVAAPPGAQEGGNQAPTSLPTFNLTGQTIGGASNMLGSGAGGGGQGPVKVFVTETDISNVQGKVNVIQGNSLFGG
jgi:hypothetical protein